MQFTTSLYAILAVFTTLAAAAPQGFGGGFGMNGFGGIPFDTNFDDNQNYNVNLNDNVNDNEEFEFNEFDNFNAINNILDTFCTFDGETGELQFLGKRSDLVKRNGGFGGGFGGFPGFDNFDFNNNQNANVNQNANLDENFLQSINNEILPMNNGDFINGFAGGSFNNLIDCFFNEEGILVAGKR
ncbi:hypothetical protein EV426DRAFT_575384 [Tirmania nivea]|nr:hypothetical protein EV426DRAFT_575384 [Tirmania nivea]